MTNEKNSIPNGSERLNPPNHKGGSEYIFSDQEWLNGGGRYEEEEINIDDKEIDELIEENRCLFRECFFETLEEEEYYD